MEIDIGRYPREGWSRHGDIPGYDKDNAHADFACIILRDTGELKDHHGKRVCFEVKGTDLYDGIYIDATLHILPSVYGYYDLSINEIWKGHPEDNGTVTIHFYTEDEECPLGDKTRESKNYKDYKNRTESFGFGVRMVDRLSPDIIVILITLVVVACWFIDS